MNWKKTLALSLAALAVAGAISGCGGDKKAGRKEGNHRRHYTGLF